MRNFKTVKLSVVFATVMISSLGQNGLANSWQQIPLDSQWQYVQDN